MGLNRIKSAFLVSILVVSFSAPAMAVTFGIVGAGTFAMPAATGAASPTGKLGFPGGGIMLGFPLGSKVMLELDALYLTRLTNSGGSDVTQTNLEGVAGFRFHLGNVVSLLAGGYYNYGLDLKSAGAAITYAAYGIKNSELGATGGLAFDFMLGKSCSLHFEGRFNYMFGNVSTVANTTLAYNEVVGLVGLRFGGSGKK